MPISSEQLVEEIAAKLSRILDAHGPQAVAAFLGNGVSAQSAASGMMISFLAAIGSKMMFSAGTIDQPGLLLAKALHGDWQGGRVRSADWNAMLMVGGNPVVSKQHLPQNPAWQLKELTGGGMELVVIDPRRTETARRAKVHLQAIPGEDATVLAGLLHLIFELGGVDEAFVAGNAQGLEDLRQAVAGFTPDYVAARAGIAAGRSRRRRARADRGGAGRHRAGRRHIDVDPRHAQFAISRCASRPCAASGRARASRFPAPRCSPRGATGARSPAPPVPAWGYGHVTSVRGLQETPSGMPTAALPDLMITDAPDRVRAFFIHGGAYYAWPDTAKTVKALGELDLFVMHDVELSGTGAHADYLIATYDQLETPAMSQLNELVGDLHPGYDWHEPYAFYHPPLLPPPEGADLMESWQVYYRVAQKLGIPLSYYQLRRRQYRAGAVRHGA